MITYEVTAEVEAHLAAAYERYMRETHIPALLETDCFHAAALTRSAPGRYRVRYEARSQADLDRYLSAHAPRLRGEFAARFPVGVTLSREVWVLVEGWQVGSAAPD
jgi:hypothetical protein